MTLVDETYLKSCPQCGAVVLPQSLGTHGKWHQAIVTLTEAVHEINENSRDINRNVGDLARLVKEHLEINLAARVGPEVGFRGPAYDEPI